MASSVDPALLASMPLLLQRELTFPYLDGYQFVNSLGGQGNWDAVNAAWDKLPASTEQIMHPEKYPSDKPVKIALPDVAAALGSGWTTSYTQTLGELITGVVVADGQAGDTPIAGVPMSLPNAAAAAGWGGDRAVSLEGPNGTWAVVWQTDWDTSGDADEFSAAAGPVLDKLPTAHALLPGADIAGGLSAPVLVIVASDDATLQQVESSLNVGN